MDLVGKPGCLCDPDSSLNGPSSVSISSPLRFPQLKPANIEFKSLAKLYFADCLNIDFALDESVAGMNLNSSSNICLYIVFFY